jgi:hypothetical protein
MFSKLKRNLNRRFLTFEVLVRISFEKVNKKSKWKFVYESEITDLGLEVMAYKAQKYK